MPILPRDSLNWSPRFAEYSICRRISAVGSPASNPTYVIHIASPASTSDHRRAIVRRFMLATPNEVHKHTSVNEMTDEFSVSEKIRVIIGAREQTAYAVVYLCNSTFEAKSMAVSFIEKVNSNSAGLYYVGLLEVIDNVFFKCVLHHRMELMMFLGFSNHYPFLRVALLNEGDRQESGRMILRLTPSRAEIELIEVRKEKRREKIGSILIFWAWFILERCSMMDNPRGLMLFLPPDCHSHLEADFLKVFSFSESSQENSQGWMGTVSIPRMTFYKQFVASLPTNVSSVYSPVGNSRGIRNPLRRSRALGISEAPQLADIRRRVIGFGDGPGFPRLDDPNLSRALRQIADAVRDRNPNLSEGDVIAIDITTSEGRNLHHND